MNGVRVVFWGLLWCVWFASCGGAEVRPKKEVLEPPSEPSSCGVGSQSVARPWARTRHRVVEVGGEVWASGGYTRLPGERCVQPLAWWDGGASILQGEGRWGHSATVLSSGEVLVLGGSKDDPEVSPFAMAGGERWRGGKWVSALDWERPRAFHSATRRAGELVVAGGASSHEEALKRVEVLDLETWVWREEVSLQGARRDHFGFAWGDEVWVLGGVREAGCGRGCARDCVEDEDCPGELLCHEDFFCVEGVSSAERVSAGSSIKPTMLVTWEETRVGMGAVQVGERVLVLGGRARGGARDDGFWLDLSGGKRREISPMLEPGVGQSVTLLPDGRVLVAGGRRLVEEEFGSEWVWSDLVQIYDPATDRWAERGRLRHARAEHRALWWRGGVWIFGGEGPSGSVAEVEEVMRGPLQR